MKNLTNATIFFVFLWHTTAVVAVGAGRSGKSTKLTISKVGLDRKTFNPSKNEAVRVNFEINRKADVHVIIYDRSGRQVRRFKPANTEAGKKSIEWDGRKSNGQLAGGEVFLYVIDAASNGQKTVYNRAGKTCGQLIKPRDYTLDKKTGKIEYVLPKACMVRIRAGLKDSMLARTVFDWQGQKAGRHIEMWDGKDVSGLMNLLKHPDLELKLTCYTLPANTIIATGQTVPSKPLKTGKNPGRKNDPWAKKGKYVHYTHEAGICHEPRFTVSFPAVKEIKGVPVVSGETRIRVELDERDARDLINKRFEIMLFVDGAFFFEMEEGTSPFTFNWNTSRFTRGSHIVSVNIMSYDDHVGVVSRKVVIGD